MDFYVGAEGLVIGMGGGGGPKKCFYIYMSAIINVRGESVEVK